MHAQIDRIAYAHTSFFTTAVAEELADHLIAHAPRGMSHVYLVSGGSEAIEAALKLARQYFVETGEPQRRRFIARRQSYHGNTLGALAVGGNAWRRQQFAPLLIDVTHVAPVLRISRPPRRRDAGGLRPAPRRRARRHDPGRRPRHGHRLRRRDRSSAQHWARARRARLLARRARGVRSPRRAADRGRGDVRHGPDRHAARRRAGGRRARPHGDRQGPRRRLPADRRRARAAAHHRRASRRAAASSSTATRTSGIPSPAPPRWPCRR